MMSDTFGISPFQGQTKFCDYSSGLHPTLSDMSLSAMKTNVTFDRLQIVTVQDILDGNRMNLPLMEEVTKRAQKAKADAHPSLFGE